MQLDPELVNQLGDEIGRERYAVAAYTEIASWADANAFSGLRAWADKQAEEEAGHARAMIEYLRDRAECHLGPVPEPEAPDSYLNALESALLLERTVSAAIGGMYHIAQNLSDGATMAFLGPFLSEQVTAERDLEIYIQKVGRGAPLDLLDAELFE